MTGTRFLVAIFVAVTMTAPATVRASTVTSNSAVAIGSNAGGLQNILRGTAQYSEAVNFVAHPGAAWSSSNTRSLNSTAFQLSSPTLQSDYHGSTGWGQMSSGITGLDGDTASLNTSILSVCDPAPGEGMMIYTEVTCSNPLTVYGDLLGTGFTTDHLVTPSLKAGTSYVTQGSAEYRWRISPYEQSDANAFFSDPNAADIYDVKLSFDFFGVPTADVTLNDALYYNSSPFATFQFRDAAGNPFSTLGDARSYIKSQYESLFSDSLTLTEDSANLFQVWVDLSNDRSTFSEGLQDKATASDFEPMPEPSSLLALGGGLVMLVGITIRKRR